MKSPLAISICWYNFTFYVLSLNSVKLRTTFSFPIKFLSGCLKNQNYPVAFICKIWVNGLPWIKKAKIMNF